MCTRKDIGYFTGWCFLGWYRMKWVASCYSGFEFKKDIGEYEPSLCSDFPYYLIYPVFQWNGFTLIKRRFFSI